MFWGKRKARQKIGDFEVLSLINRGGMAELYQVRLDGQMYALKMSRVVGNPERFKHFNEAIKKEAALLAGLDHKRIVKIFPIPARSRRGTRNTYAARCTTCPGKPWYLILEYLEGGTLEDFVKREGPLTVFEATNIIGNVALGLNYLHSKNIVHKDLSARNVLFRSPPARGGPFDPVIIDFGTVEGILKREAHEAGTLQIMAPERLKALQPHRAPETQAHLDLTKSDIWSLGILLYLCLSGRLPFNAHRRKSLTTSILYKDPEPIRVHNSEVDEDLERFVLFGMLAKDPRARPSLTEVLHFLKPYGSRRLREGVSV